MSGWAGAPHLPLRMDHLRLTPDRPLVAAGALGGIPRRPTRPPFIEGIAVPGRFQPLMIVVLAGYPEGGPVLPGKRRAVGTDEPLPMQRRKSIAPDGSLIAQVPVILASRCHLDDSLAAVTAYWSPITTPAPHGGKRDDHPVSGRREGSSVALRRGDHSAFPSRRPRTTAGASRNTTLTAPE